MPREPKQFSLKDGPLIERAIILQLLRDDHAERWSKTELRVKISDAETSAVHKAIDRLHEVGVLVWAGEAIRASRCTRHLDELELISI
jgi:hypothetical protein